MAERVMRMLFADAQHKSYVTSHADGFVAKIRVLGSMCSNLGRIFGLFPSECLGYSAQLLENAVSKYFNTRTCGI